MTFSRKTSFFCAITLYSPRKPWHRDQLRLFFLFFFRQSLLVLWQHNKLMKTWICWITVKLFLVLHCMFYKKPFGKRIWGKSYFLKKNAVKSTYTWKKSAITLFSLLAKRIIEENLNLFLPNTTLSPVMSIMAP